MRLSDIIRGLRGIFERKRKNPVLLSTDSNLESKLKPLKVANKNTPIQISEDTVDVKGNLNVNGQKVVTVGTDGIHSLNDLSDVTYSDGDLTIDSLDTIIASGDLLVDSAGDINLDAAGLDINFKVGGTAYFNWNALGTAFYMNPVSPTKGIRIDVSDTADLTIESVGSLNLFLQANGAGNIYLNAGLSSVFFQNDGTSFLSIDMSSAGTANFEATNNYHLKLTSQGTGDINLDSNGDIILDSADGNFIAKKAGTEFSAANSSYAGMILGYTDIGLDESRADYNLTTSFAVPTDEFSVSFKAPPSGNVEISIQIQFGMGSSGIGDLYVGLSTANATSGYSALHDYHEELNQYRGWRSGVCLVTHSWTLTGLTAGTSYEYWVGFKSSTTTGTPVLQWGGDGSLHFPSFIMKATALPATITT